MAMFKYMNCRKGDPVPENAVRVRVVNNNAIPGNNIIYARAKDLNGNYLLGVVRTTNSKALSLPLAFAPINPSSSWTFIRSGSMTMSIKRPALKERNLSLSGGEFFDKKHREHFSFDEYEVLTSTAHVKHVQCKSGGVPPKGAIVGCFSDDTGPSYHARCSYYAKCSYRQSQNKGLPCICIGTVGVTAPSSNVLAKACTCSPTKMDEAAEFEWFEMFDVLTIQNLKDDITKIEMVDNKANVVSGLKVLETKTLTNNTTKPKKSDFTYNKSVTNTMSLSYDFGAEVRVGTEIMCKFPTLNEGKITFNVEEPYKMQWGKSKSVTKAYTGSDVVEVPPNSSNTYAAVITESELTVPYRIHWLSGMVSVGKWHCLYNWGFRLNVEKQCLVDKIVDVEFDVKRSKKASTPKIIATQTLTNDTSIEQRVEFTYSEEVTDESSFSHEFGVEIGVGTEFSCGLPTIAEGKISVEAKAAYNMEWGKSKSTTRSFSGSIPVTVPANSTIECKALFTEDKLKVPYKISWLSGDVSEGIWHGVKSWDLKTIFKENRKKRTIISVAMELTKDG
jgi:hypothetical protein